MSTYHKDIMFIQFWVIKNSLSFCFCLSYPYYLPAELQIVIFEAGKKNITLNIVTELQIAVLKNVAELRIVRLLNAADL